MALSFDEYARQLQSGKSAVPTIKAPASATSIGGLSSSSLGSFPSQAPSQYMWNYGGYDSNMYTFNRNGQSGGTRYGYNPSQNKWYSQVVGVQNPVWKDYSNTNNYLNKNTGMLNFIDGGYYLKDGSLWKAKEKPGQASDTLLYEWKQPKPKPDPYVPPTPDPDPDPTPDPNAYEEYLKQLEAMKAQYEAQLKAMQDASAARQAEADATKAAAEKQGRITDRTGALQQSGLWDLVNQMYGGNTDDLNSYLTHMSHSLWSL